MMQSAILNARSADKDCIVLSDCELLKDSITFMESLSF